MDSKEIEDTIPALREFAVQQGGSGTAGHTTVPHQTVSETEAA